jgi:exodeoxyribonuclease VII large subunit
MIAANLAAAKDVAIRRQNEQLNAYQKLLEVLSPAATLQRGYSITRLNGHAVSAAATVPAGSTIEITLADGMLTATTK